MRAWPAPTVPVVMPTPPETPVLAFDTASRSLTRVGPRTPVRPATLYVCGITPYDATHLGHAFTYLSFDLLKRAWLDAGLQVRHVQNVTDVDDPLLERAAATGRDWRELAAEQIELFRTDMTALRILPPDEHVGATEALEEVAGLIGILNERGKAYPIDDREYPDWYARCRTAPGFGSVAHLSEQQMLTEFAAKGGDPDRPGKRDPLDALLWRQERPGEPAWESPWGRGRPGWHVECTAIAQSRLGATIDVQGGGRDLAFPHHEMCAAHGSAATGQPFARAYLHVGMVGLDGEKMSKSLGNLELVSRLRAQGVHPMVIRLALLDHHYRQDWEWRPDLIGGAQRRLDAWRLAARAEHGPEAAPTIAALRAALRTDLDAPTGLRVIDEWTAATLAGEGEEAGAPAQLAEAVDALLGVQLR